MKIEVRDHGLAEARKALRQAGDDLPAALREAYRLGGEIIIAATTVPVRSGRLASTLRSAPTQRAGRVRMGTPSRVPYAGWVEFGGRILFPNRSAARTGQSFSKGRVSVRETAQILGGTVRYRKRRTEILVGDHKPGKRSTIAGADSGAVVAHRPFVPEGRYLYPAFVSRLGDVRRVTLAEIEDVMRRAGLPMNLSVNN